MHFNFISYFEK